MVIYMENIDDLVQALGIMVAENNDKDFEEFKIKYEKNENCNFNIK